MSLTEYLRILGASWSVRHGALSPHFNRALDEGKIPTLNRSVAIRPTSLERSHTPSESNMATPDQSPLNPTNKAILSRMFAHPANDTASHLARVLSSAAGIDSTLLLIGYSLNFVSDQLSRVLKLELKAIAERAAANASKSLLPGETVIATLPVPAITSRISNLRDSTKIFSGMCSDVRAFMRLWGLLKMWLLARATYANPPKDTTLRNIAWGQIVSISGYYALEHYFYLAGKGVYKAKPEDIGKWFRTSIYAYGAYLFLDYVRLYRESQLEQATTASEKLDTSKKQVAERQWYKALQVNAGYTPLCFHWATPGGYLSDSAVGLLGAFAGMASFKEAWRQTA